MVQMSVPQDFNCEPRPSHHLSDNDKVRPVLMREARKVTLRFISKNGVAKMPKPKSKILLVCMVVILCSNVSSFARQEITSEKKHLISEFRKLTGGDVVNRSINFSADSLQKLFASIVEDDKEITEAQKVELQKSAAEAAVRTDKIVRDFLNDNSQITALEEEVIFKIYDRAFTENELRELIGFYETPAGQKALRFLRGLSRQVQNDFGEVMRVKINGLLQPRIQMETEQLKQKIRDAKAKRSEN
jgi:hypothetical protein